METHKAPGRDDAQNERKRQKFPSFFLSFPQFPSSADSSQKPADMSLEKCSLQGTSPSGPEKGQGKA